MACLQRMKLNHTYDRLHGVYVIGSVCECQASNGVQMEMHMACVLDIPVFAQFCDDNEIALNMQVMISGKRLLDNGDFGKENWSEKIR